MSVTTKIGRLAGLRAMQAAKGTLLWVMVILSGCGLLQSPEVDNHTRLRSLCSDKEWEPSRLILSALLQTDGCLNLVDRLELADTLNLTAHGVVHDTLSLRFLSFLPKLKRLRIIGLAVSDVDYLAGLSKLEDLTIDFSGISELELNRLVSSLLAHNVLSNLSFRGNNINQLNFFVENTSLKYLDAAGNNLHSIEEVPILRGLRTANFKQNPIADMAPLTTIYLLTWFATDQPRSSDRQTPTEDTSDEIQ